MLPRTVFIALALLVAAGCSDGTDATSGSTLDAVLERGELIIGTEPEFKPFESKNEKGEFVGFDMDMARELAKDLGVKLRIEEMGFPSLIPALKTGMIDLAISGMTATEERAEVVTFSDCYFETGLCLLVNADSGIEKSEDANGKRFVVKQGTTGQKNVPLLFPDSKELTTVMQTEGECANEVALGRADAFLYDQLSVLGASKKHAKTTRALLAPLTHEPYAMAVRRGDTMFVERINRFLADIRKDGRYKAMRDVYLRELPDGSR